MKLGSKCIGALLLAAVAVAGCNVVGTGLTRLPPRAAPSGAWTDEEGRPLALSSFRGAPLVMSAFFTSCTMRCHMTVEKLKAVDRAYAASGVAVSIVVLALDPKNDTPSRLARFKRDHGLSDHWHFLWGSMNDTRKLAKALSVNAAYDDGHIDHDVEIAVFDAYGRLARSYGGWAFDPSDAVVH